MCCVRFPTFSTSRKAVERPQKPAQHLGKRRQVQYYLASLAIIDGQSLAQ
jgi:hypothetical protein